MESNIILHTSNNGEAYIQMQHEDRTLECTQKRMANLLGVNMRIINKHLKRS